ncbi:MAG TPA: hypothetical protein ENK12_03045 [Gammaproteobacteria bacterium]|nr:hypothetical protein [Gammaproteobacteria bacterium]
MKGYRTGALLATLILLAACGRNGAEPEQTATMEPAQSSAGCDPVQERCEVTVEGLALAVRLGPGVKALNAFPLRVWPALEPDARVDKFFVSFTMSGMDMGMNRYRLSPQPDGSWLAEVTLPICTSGRTDWIATIELRTDKGHWRVAVPFVLAPP